jgi:hypothetical protein
LFNRSRGRCAGNCGECKDGESASVHDFGPFGKQRSKCAARKFLRGSLDTSTIAAHDYGARFAGREPEHSGGAASLRYARSLLHP